MTEKVRCVCGERVDVQEREPIIRGADPRGVTIEEFADCPKCQRHFSQADLEHWSTFEKQGFTEKSRKFRGGSQKGDCRPLSMPMQAVAISFTRNG